MMRTQKTQNARDGIHELRRLALLNPYPTDIARPRTRGDCIDGPRPCPWVSCRQHLAYDVRPSGSLTTVFPLRALEALPDTCALDVADRGATSLEDIGERLNIVRERVRQLEAIALARVRKLAPHLFEPWADEMAGGTFPATLRTRSRGVAMLIEARAAMRAKRERGRIQHAKEEAEEEAEEDQG